RAPPAGRGTPRRCWSRRRWSRRAPRARCRPRSPARSRRRPVPGSRARRRRSRAAPSRGRRRQRGEVERGLLVRVRLAHRRPDPGLALLRVDGLEPKLGHPLLTARLPDARLGPLAAEERAGALGEPRAALVVADAAGAGFEERLANRIERLTRHEDD